MARGRTIEDADVQQQATLDETSDTGFGAEFRELARQRRFVRSDQDHGEATGRRASWRDEAAPPRRTAAAPTAAPRITPPPAAPSPALAHATAPAPRPRVDERRISDDQRATLRELARMSDRLVDSREQLVRATSRVSQLEAELGAARQRQVADEQRVLASRLLVQDAQKLTRELGERCAWLEGRCETLQEALELAVNASWTTRWRWRREQRARARS